MRNAVKTFPCLLLVVVGKEYAIRCAALPYIAIEEGKRTRAASRLTAHVPARILRVRGGRRLLYFATARLRNGCVVVASSLESLVPFLLPADGFTNHE